MATHLKIRSRSFQRNLLSSIGGIFILFALCFSFYQYNREKEFKIDIMQSRLQMYSYEMMQSLGDSIVSPTKFAEYVKTHNVEGLRVTLIDLHGDVILDSRQTDVSKMGNHLHREEVQEALRKGSGYDLKRASESTNETYFYSATKTDNHIIRIAVPYSTQLTESLKPDNTYLVFTLILTILLGLVLYYNTTRIGKHIGYLREFAVKAEEGEEIDQELERALPDDELGDISHTIITLYWKLRHSEEDKVRIKRQLTQNAAHELKTPAASIHGFLESIIDNPDMSVEQRQHFLERCYAQSERMNKLLLDMAQLTKLDELPTKSKKDIDKNNLVDVVPIIHNVLDDTSLQLQEKNILQVVELPSRIIISSPLSEPEGAIYSVFRNLVDNAVAYATGATEIRISYANNEFTFADNGIGVPAEHLPHLAERFYRVDKGRSRKLGGTGLGLAIVKNVVVAHGGTLKAEQTLGGGLTFRFGL